MEFYISKHDFNIIKESKYDQRIKITLYPQDRNISMYFGVDYSQYVTKITIEEIKNWLEKEIANIL